MTKCPSNVPTEAPSVLVTRGLTARAARSVRIARLVASSVDSAQEWCNRRSGASRSSNAASGRHAAGTAAVDLSAVERPVGKECVSKGRFRGSTGHYKKKHHTKH